MKNSVVFRVNGELELCLIDPGRMIYRVNPELERREVMKFHKITQTKHETKNTHTGNDSGAGAGECLSGAVRIYTPAIL